MTALGNKQLTPAGNSPLVHVVKLVSSSHAWLVGFTPSSQIQLAAGRECLSTWQSLSDHFHKKHLPFLLSRLAASTADSSRYNYSCLQYLVNQVQTYTLELKTRRCTFSFGLRVNSDSHTWLWFSDERLGSCITSRWAHQNQPAACGDSCCHWVILIWLLMTQYLQLPLIRLVDNELLVTEGVVQSIFTYLVRMFCLWSFH